MMILCGAVGVAAVNSRAQEDSFDCLGNGCCSKRRCGLLQSWRAGWVWSMKVLKCYRENRNSAHLGTTPEASSQPRKP